MRAIIYARVSSDPKGVGRSVAEQEAECRQVCERQGWEVAKVFTDNDRSAYNKKARPAYAELIRFVSGGRCDVLVTWEASRFQRDLEAYVSLRDLCRNKGVLWSYSGRTYDLSRLDDRLSTGLDALLAERESDLTRERILRSVRANAAEGRPHGKRPYGYAREYDATTGELLRQIIREDQAEVIREAARRFLAGESTYAIASNFNIRGISAPSGGKWVLGQVKRMISNPTYIALRTHKGKVVGKAAWPPILNEATFYQCQARLADPRRKSVRDGAIKHLLSGLAVCGVCGGRTVVLKGRGVVQYVCHDKFCVARKSEWVDELITELVLARLSQPDATGLFIRDDDGEVGRVLDEVATLRARLDSFYDAAADGELSASALGRIEAKLLSEIEALENQVRRIELPTAIYDLSDDPHGVWESLSIVQRREIIRVLLDIRIMPSKTVKGSRKFDPDSIAVTWKQHVTQNA